MFILLHKIPLHLPRQCLKWARRTFSSEATFEKSYDLHLLTDGPSKTVTVTKPDAMRYYSQMQDLRNLEQTCANLYTKKLIRGFCHLYTGQEGTGVGIHASMQPEDTLITSYRCHGFTYLMGASLAGVIGELLGRVTGVSKGKGGSMHLYAKNFYGGNGIVGGQVPLGNGIGFRHKYLSKNAVSYTLYGDGAANQGQVFESYNLAKLNMLPVIFACENNLYAMGTSQKRSCANPNYYTVCNYIPGIRVDGMDVLAVREAFRFAREYARSKGPIILESLTYRYFGHSMSDPGISYRSRDEIADVRQKSDPIRKFRELVIEKKLATEEEFKAIDKESKARCADAEKEALAAAPPGLNTLSLDVYSKHVGCPIRNVSVFEKLPCGSSQKPINMD